MNVNFTGAYYGDDSTGSVLNETLHPFLEVLPPPIVSVFSAGSYIESVEALAGVDPAGGQPLNTSSGSDVPETFYAKSLMTPEDAPMSAQAIDTFITYLAHEGFDFPAVRSISVIILLIKMKLFSRVGLWRSSSSGGETPRSTGFH